MLNSFLSSRESGAKKKLSLGWIGPHDPPEYRLDILCLFALYMGILSSGSEAELNFIN